MRPHWTDFSVDGSGGAAAMRRIVDAPGYVTDDPQSYKRTGWEERSGQGNGIGGHDETAADTAASWSTDFSPPSPEVVELTC